MCELGKLKQAGLAIVLLAVLLASVSCKPRQISSDEALAFVQKYEIRVEYLNRRLAEEKWEMATGGHSDSLDYFLDLEKSLLNDNRILSALTRYRSLNNDEKLQRKLDIIWRRHLRAAIDGRREISSLADSLMNIAGQLTVNVSDRNYPVPEIGEVISITNSRALRETVWVNRAQSVASLADGITMLIRLRNQAAQRLGYNSYYDLMLLADGIDRQKLQRYLDDLAEKSRDPFLSSLDSIKNQLGVDHVFPWDIEFVPGRAINAINPFLAAERQKSLLQETFAGLGINLKALPLYYTSGDNSLSDQVLYAHIPEDIRVIHNSVDGSTGLIELFGQTGRAFYAANIDQKEYLMALSPAPCFEIAQADIITGLTQLEDWLIKYAGVPVTEIDRIKSGLAFKRLYDLRYMLMMIAFEQEMYRDPYGNPDDLYIRLYEEYLRLKLDKGYSGWALESDLVTNPVTTQNELLAQGITAQTYSYLTHKYGSVLDNSRTREFLVQNYYRFGRSENWETLVMRGTGEALKADYYLDYCQM